ncbi:hypothetical protein PybrP1_004039 [[Pythium] brassicae (nom. inval.)]|nr:hypothetical protein PybrP1_004039 [[Pythium] brassicae (nom. inval.)]
MVHFAKLLAVGVLAFQLAAAHPGDAHVEKTQAQIAHRKLFQANAHRSIKACADAPHVRELEQQLAARRAARVEELRQMQAARGRSRQLDAATVLAKSHKTTLAGVTTATDPTTLFGSTPQCILEPQVTEGPYYVKGEFIRTDIRESQPGVDLHTELQIIDVNTCKPVENLYVDFWHCNITGVYSGVVARGNGNSADPTNSAKAFNRGLAPTDADRLVNFLTTFPGHYAGRAAHIHVLGTHDGTVLSNNTYSGGKVSHVGQIFFDQSLIAQVEATTAYSANTQTLTTNAWGAIFSQSAASTFDPVMQYALLGDSTEDGIFAWISIGIDMTVVESVNAATTLTSAGGATTSGGTPTSGGSTPSPSPSSAASSLQSASVLATVTLAAIASFYH